MPGFDVSAKEPYAVQGALICGETDDGRIHAAYPLFQVCERQWPITQVIENYALVALLLHSCEDITHRNRDALRVLEPYFMIYVNKKKSQLRPLTLSALGTAAYH